MSNDNRETKPETKPALPFFAQPTDKPMTTRSGVRAGTSEAGVKRGGG